MSSTGRPNEGAAAPELSSEPPPPHPSAAPTSTVPRASIAAGPDGPARNPPLAVGAGAAALSHLGEDPDAKDRERDQAAHVGRQPDCPQEHERARAQRR